MDTDRLERVILSRPGSSRPVVVPQRAPRRERDLDSSDPGAPERVPAVLSHALVAARVRRGLRRDQVARAASLPVDVVANLELGRGTRPPEATVAKLERALGCRLPRR